jgi:hypothetical protein
VAKMRKVGLKRESSGGTFGGNSKIRLHRDLATKKIGLKSDINFKKSSRGLCFFLIQHIRHAPVSLIDISTR